LIADVLTAEGYEVIAACDGSELIGHLQALHAARR
jgi:hypothetical protein